MDRRGFLSGIIAGAMAPAIVKTESLMKIVAPKQDIILPVPVGQPYCTGEKIEDRDLWMDFKNDILYIREGGEWKDVKSFQGDIFAPGGEYNLSNHPSGVWINKPIHFNYS